MISLSRGYPNDGTVNCQKCRLHCLPRRELQAKISKLKTENQSLKQERQEWLTEQRRCILRLGDYSDEVQQLKTKLKEEEETNRCIVLDLKKALDEKKEVMKQFEMCSLKVDTHPEKQNLSDIKLSKLEEEKNHLELQLKKLSEENNKLMKNLESKSQTIQRFLNEQVKLIKYNDMKTTARLFRAFNIVRNRMDVRGAEHLNIMQTLQEVQQSCQNCRASSLKAKEEYESKISKLEHEKINERFLLEQQSNLINQLKFEQEKLKKELKEGLISRKEKECHQDDKECHQNNEKLVKEKGEILLPPTPDSWSTSQDTSNEDISFDIQQSNPSDSHIQTQDPNDMKNQVGHHLGDSKTKKKQKKHSKSNSDCLNSNSKDIINSENCDEFETQTERKNEDPFDSNRVDDDVTGDCNIMNVNELSTKNLCDALSKTAENGPEKISKLLSPISSKQSISKESLTHTSNIFPKENVLIQHEESRSPSLQISLTTDRSKSPKNAVWGDCKVNIICSTPLLKKSMAVSVTENVPPSTEFVEPTGQEKPCHFTSDDANSVIGSEGWSPAYDFEHDFEHSLSQLARFPAMISPLRLSTDEPVKSTYRLERGDGDFVPLEVNSKQPKSIFSPVLRSDSPGLSEIKHEDLILSFGPEEIIEGNCQQKLNCDIENNKSTVSDKVIKNIGKTGVFDCTNEPKNKPCQKSCSEKKKRFEASSTTVKSDITKRGKNKKTKRGYIGKEKVELIRSLEDDIKPNKFDNKEICEKRILLKKEIEANITSFKSQATKRSKELKKIISNENPHSDSPLGRSGHDKMKVKTVLNDDKRSTGPYVDQCDGILVDDKCEILGTSENPCDPENEHWETEVSLCINKLSSKKQQNISGSPKESALEISETPDNFNCRKVHSVSPLLLDPDPPNEENVDSVNKSPNRKNQQIKLSREMKALGLSLSPGNLFSSPCATNYETSPPVSPRSPTAMEHYNLRLSPKPTEKVQYCEKSPVEERNTSPFRKSYSKTPKNQKVKTEKRGSVSPTVIATINHCSHYNNQTPPRSPESLRHYNMRVLASPKNCDRCDSLGVEVRSTKRLKTDPTSVPQKFEKSTVLPNLASNHVEVLSEITVQSSKEGSGSLDAKLKLTPEVRLVKLKEQESLLTPIEINVDFKQSKHASKEDKCEITMAQDNSAQVEIQRSKMKSTDQTCKDFRSSMTTCTQNLDFNSDQFSQPFRVYQSAEKQKTSNFSSSNALLKIADSIPKELLTTKEIKLNAPVLKNIENPIVIKSQLTKNDQQICKYPPKHIDVTPVHKSRSTVGKKELFKDSDMAFKITSYRNCLFNITKSGRSTSFKKRQLTKEVLRVLRFYRLSCKKLHRQSTINRLKQCTANKILKTAKCRMKYSRGFKSEHMFNANKLLEVNSTVPKFEEKPDRKLIKSPLEKMKNSNKALQKISSSVSVDTLNKKVNVSSVNNGQSCPTSECNSNLTRECSAGTVSGVIKPCNSLLSPSSDFNKSEDEGDCLVIDIDEHLMDLDDETDPLFVEYPSTPAYQSTQSTKETCSKKPNDVSEQKGVSEVSQKTPREINNIKSLGSTSMVFHNKDNSYDDIDSSFIPNFEPLPDAMCKYREDLVKTNTDFSRPENRVLPFPTKKGTPSEDQGGSSHDVFFPNFYTEHQPKEDNPETAGSAKEDANEEESYSACSSDNYIYKVKTLNDLIPKGEKIEVTENILRTAVHHHKENLSLYKERNFSERRTPEAGVPADLVEKVVKIVTPLLTEDVKSIGDIFKAAENLEQFEIRVIVKGLMMSLYRLATEAIRGTHRTSWMFNWEVNQINKKKSPFVHPRIQSAHLLLYFMIDRFTSKRTKEEKIKFLEEELYFMELAFIGAIPEFSESMAVFWLNLGFLYTLLARQSGQLLRVRQLIYDLLYCFTKRAITVTFAVLHTWPTVLLTRPIEFYSGDPLTLAIILQLTASVPTYDVPTRLGHMVHQLRDLLFHRYKYRAGIVDPDQLFDLCLRRLDQHGVLEAVVLLAKRQRHPWFTGRPLQQLLDVVEGWWKGGDECSDARAVVAINAICSALKCYQYTQIQPELGRVLDLFRNVLLDENTPLWMQEVIVLNLCRLCRVNLNLCLDVIINWRPTEISQNVIDQILLNVFGRRSPHWWITNQVGRFYLCHR